MKLEIQIKEIINDFVLPSFQAIHVEHLSYLSSIKGYALKIPPKENIISFISEIYVCLFNREDYDYNKTVIKYVDYLVDYSKFTGDKNKLLKDIKQILHIQISCMESVLEIRLNELDTNLNKKNVKMLERIFSTYVLEGNHGIGT